MDKLKILDVVVLIEPLPLLNLRKGELGTIVEIFDKDVFLVEFTDTKGVTYAITSLKSDALMKVYYEPVVAWWLILWMGFEFGWSPFWVFIFRKLCLCGCSYLLNIVECFTGSPGPTILAGMPCAEDSKCHKSAYFIYQKKS